MPSIEQSDAAELLLANDERALEDILRIYGPQVRAVLGRKYEGILNRHDIEDVFAIGLFRVWHHRGKFDPSKGSLRVWFCRIVDNAARDVLRHGWHKARQFEVHVDFAGYVDPKANGKQREDANNSTPTAEQLEIRDIVDSLPEAQRHIITADALAKDAPASSRFLAEELGLSTATIRVYRKRAMDSIRQELKRRGYSLDRDGCRSHF
jgi:RNA polymerase sigma factor (sigma-70 family)